jgi:hypothetical protein
MGYQDAREGIGESEIAEANAEDVESERGVYSGKTMSPTKFAVVCAIAAAMAGGVEYVGKMGIEPLYAIQIVYSMSLAILAILAYRNIKTVKYYGGASASILTFSIVSIAMIWLGINGILSAVIAFFLLAKNELI